MHMVLFLKKLTVNRKKKILPQDIQLRFLSRLSRLLGDGYPLIESLEIIKWDKQMIKPATEVIRSLKAGELIDQAFERARFHPTITSYLYFSRVNGDFQASIDKCAE